MMKVGNTIYYFDPNHREYKRDEAGKSRGGAIWIKHWIPREIKGETKVSWLVGPKWHPDKLNKKKLAAGELTAYAVTWEEVEILAWVNSNRYKIARKLESEHDASKLKAIAEILGYIEEAQ